MNRMAAIPFGVAAIFRMKGVHEYCNPYIWTSITPKEFYDKLRAGSRASTSAVSLGRYLEFFTQCAEEGTPTVYLCFTSALSSSYNSAVNAAEEVRAKYPGFELFVVDNALPCACGELLAIEAVRQRAAGLTARQLASWADASRRRRRSCPASSISSPSSRSTSLARFRSWG